MKLSSLSLIYLALSALVLAAVLVVHNTYPASGSAAISAPLSFGAMPPAHFEGDTTAVLWHAGGAIEM